MRAWIVLLEVGISILLLTTFYIYIRSNLPEYEKTTLFTDPEIYRSIDYDCSKFPNLTYYYYNFSKGIYCKDGYVVKRLEGEPTFIYLYAGDKTYNPKVIAIFR